MLGRAPPLETSGSQSRAAATLAGLPGSLQRQSTKMACIAARRPRCQATKAAKQHFKTQEHQCSHQHQRDMHGCLAPRTGLEPPDQQGRAPVPQVHRRQIRQVMHGCSAPPERQGHLLARLALKWTTGVKQPQGSAREMQHATGRSMQDLLHEHLPQGTLSGIRGGCT